MRPEGKKLTKSERRLRQYTTMAVLCIACAIVGRGVYGMWSTFTRAQHEAHVSQVDLEKIHARSVKSSAEAAKIDDTFGKEAVLRARFDVGLPGEQLLVIIDEDHPEIVPIIPITWVDRLKAFLVVH